MYDQRIRYIGLLDTVLENFVSKCYCLLLFFLFETNSSFLRRYTRCSRPSSEGKEVWVLF